MNRDTIRWYVVRTQPRREDLAEMVLRQRCNEVICPRYRERVILHGYRRLVTRPLFPSYLFAAFDAGRQLRSVHFARGVRGVITFGEEPAPVADALIDELRRRMHDGIVALQPRPFQPGQQVEIVAGPLAGFTGVFQSQRSGSERVAILLDTLQYQAAVILDRAAIRAVS